MSSLPAQDDTIITRDGKVLEGEGTVGSALTTVKNYSVEVKARAYELFLHTDLDLTDLAISLNVPRHVVLTWSRKGKWNDRKQDLELEAFRAAETRYRRFLTEHKLPTIERHLKAATLVEEAVIAAVEQAKQNNGVIDSMVLRRLAEALSSSAGVSSRAAGVTDRTILADDGESASEKEKARKQPLVIITTSGGPTLSSLANRSGRDDNTPVVKAIEIDGVEVEQ